MGLREDNLIGILKMVLISKLIVRKTVDRLFNHGDGGS